MIIHLIAPNIYTFILSLKSKLYSYFIFPCFLTLNTLLLKKYFSLAYACNLSTGYLSIGFLE